MDDVPARRPRCRRAPLRRRRRVCRCRGAAGTRGGRARVEAVGMTAARPSGPSESLRLARAMLRDVVPYPTERVPCDADLSDNTNLFGAPPAALRELASSVREAIRRRPGPQPRGLAAAPP